MRNRIKQLLPDWMLIILKNARYIWIITLFHIFHLLPIQKTRIVVCNVWGFGDNAKYVTEELVKRRFKKEIDSTRGKGESYQYDIIFVTNHPESADAPDGVNVIKTNSIKAVLALATAKVWVDNNRKESYIRKRRGQYYIQTWHGGIALKKIERDYEEKLGKKYRENAKKDSKMTDLYVSNSDFCTNLYRKSFWYKGKIIECGSPRTDILLHPDTLTLEKTRNRLLVKKDQKIAIYAPTYREGKNNTKAYTLDYDKLLITLKEKYGGDWVIAVRLHPLVSGQSSFTNYTSKIINASGYRDLYELMAAGDLLITDYSNIMFEFSFMEKPVFLYAADEEEYEKERGFYFKYNSLPYDRAKTMEELLENINRYESISYNTKVHAFLEKLTVYEQGTASRTLVDKIIDVIGT